MSKINFFKPEDFHLFRGHLSSNYAANYANEKLEREAKVVYGGKVCMENVWTFVGYNIGKKNTHQALIIDIKPIEKPCTHPKEKITMALEGFVLGQSSGAYQARGYICECGQEMQIKFEPVEKEK